jgi:hypothetical protein
MFNKYSTSPHTEIATPAAEEIVLILQKNKLSYDQACEALAIAQSKLGETQLSFSADD